MSPAHLRSSAGDDDRRVGRSLGLGARPPGAHGRSLSWDLQGRTPRGEGQECLQGWALVRRRSKGRPSASVRGSSHADGQRVSNPFSKESNDPAPGLPCPAEGTPVFVQWDHGALDLRGLTAAPRLGTQGSQVDSGGMSPMGLSVTSSLEVLPCPWQMLNA